MDRILITLIIDASGRKADIELPSNVPLSELLEPMLKGMNEWLSLSFQTKEYAYLISEDGQNWTAVSPDNSLTESAMMDGYYLRIEQKNSYSTV